MKIREANSNDYNSVWEIFKKVIKTGDTFVFDPKTKKDDLSKHWFAHNAKI
jgi:L-amino acid N-acyltransferase YncA